MTWPSRSLLGIAAALLVAVSGSVVAAQTEVVTVVGGELSDLPGARIVVRNETGEERLAIRIETGASATHRINLTEAETVTCTGTGLWCPDLAVADESERLVLPLFNRASFRMPIDLPTGENWTGEELQIEFWLRSNRQPDDATSQWAQADRFVVEATAADTAEGLTATWFGPADTTLDFRVAAEGWAPAYLFDVDVGPGTTTLPQAKLVRGSSLSTFVVDAETGAAVYGATVTLHLPDAEYDDERARRFRRSETTNGRGFVQLHGVPPDVYDLVLASEGRPPTHISGIELADGAETWLGSVELPGFARMTVHVDPATNNGQPWRIEAWQIDEPWTESDATTSDGMAVLRGLVQGSYEVRVIGPGDSLVRSETRVIGRDEMVFLSLDLAQVEGRVLLDGDGVRSEVDLATGGGDRSRFTTDDEGRFAGSIPRPFQDWVVAFVGTENGVNRTFRVKPRQRDGVYRLTLRLGNHGIHGQVLDSTSRDPIEGAQVMIRHPEDETFYPSNYIVDATGSFAFRGLDPDGYDLSAYFDGYTEADLTGVPAVELPAADEEGALELDGITILLRSGAPLEILLTSSEGIPERSANVSVFTLTAEGTGVGETVTDVSGRGQVVVPRSALPASVVVRAPSGVLWSSCILLPEEGQPLHLQLPPTSGGTLVLQRKKRNTADSPMPDQDLVSIDGGLLRVQDFLRWTAELGLPLPSGNSFQIPRVASGHYAVTETLPLGLGAYPAACQGAGRGAGSWEYLPAGGELTLLLRFKPIDDGGFWIPG